VSIFCLTVVSKGLQALQEHCCSDILHRLDVDITSNQQHQSLMMLTLLLPLLLPINWTGLL